MKTTDCARRSLNLRKRGGNGVVALVSTFFLVLFFSVSSNAQSFSQANSHSTDDIRWKSEEQVRRILGEPQNTKGPVGTHANYTIWEYPDFNVAFSNKKAFHLFRKDSLKTFELQENR